MGYGGRAEVRGCVMGGRGGMGVGGCSSPVQCAQQWSVTPSHDWPASHTRAPQVTTEALQPHCRQDAGSSQRAPSGYTPPPCSH